MRENNIEQLLDRKLSIQARTTYTAPPGTVSSGQIEQNYKTKTLRLLSRGEEEVVLRSEVAP